MSIRILPGSFPELPGLGISCVAIDLATNGISFTHQNDRTPGFYASVPLAAQPTNIDSWEILAFTIQLRLGLFPIDLLGAPAGYQVWARFGSLLAGIALDGSIPGSSGASPTWPPAQFPNDLSTFDTVWDGSLDDIRFVSGSAATDAILIAKTVQLPFPPKVRAGSQLSFALIMTPSFLDAGVIFMVRQCKFSIVYNEITPGL